MKNLEIKKLKFFRSFWLWAIIFNIKSPKNGLHSSFDLYAPYYTYLRHWRYFDILKKKFNMDIWLKNQILNTMLKMITIFLSYMMVDVNKIRWFLISRFYLSF